MEYSYVGVQSVEILFTAQVRPAVDTVYTGINWILSIGNVTLGDILEVLPFEDPIVVIELDGAAIWDALEAALSTFPAQEGRFPIISGFRAVWDSRRPPGQRVLGVWLTKEPSGSTTNTPLHSGSTTPAASSMSNLLQTISGSSDSAPFLTDVEEVKREKGEKKYAIVTREYMAQGHDGFLPLKGSKYLVDDESGQMMSTIVRKYLLGLYFNPKTQACYCLH